MTRLLPAWVLVIVWMLTAASGDAQQPKQPEVEPKQVSAIPLPVQGTDNRPVVLLEAEPHDGKTKDPTLRVRGGKVTHHEGADYLSVEQHRVVLSKKGFGRTRLTIRYELAGDIPANNYAFQARYMCGGEPHVSGQTVTLKAGPDPEHLQERAKFTVTNPVPWGMQWVKGPSPFAIRGDDRVLDITIEGIAHDSKVFDAFLLHPDPYAFVKFPNALLPEGMTEDSAGLRRQFYALSKHLKQPGRHLLVLDGGDATGGDVLFRALLAKPVRAAHANVQVVYYVGDDSDRTLTQLHLSHLPALVMVDEHFTALGVLTKPKTEKDVVEFLRDPGKAGELPQRSAVAAEPAQPLRKGVPAAWLVGGIHDGPAGIAVYGIDSERTARPNPRQPYLGTMMAGAWMDAWHAAPTSDRGDCVILPAATHSYGWSRGTGYAHLYFHVKEAADVVLHIQQSGFKTVAWLDGEPMRLAADTKPPIDFPKPGPRSSSPLKGLTTEGLVVTAMPEKAEPAQAALLRLTPGWHRLLVKLVMQHDRGETFFFIARFTDPSGQPIDALRTQLADPNADLARHTDAARLRPLIYVDAPANLPRPGEPLKVRVEMRWHPIYGETSLDAPILPFDAKLRLTLTDYDGKELAVREVNGRFPGEATLDFGLAPGTGYYAIQPALHTVDGKHLIMAYPSDGFSVVRGTAAQKQRLGKKKLWDNYYYAFSSGDLGFRQNDGYFLWLERSGVYKNFGSFPGFDPKYAAKWEDAKKRGLVFFGDTSGDSNWLGDTLEAGEKTIVDLAKYTRFFKCTNEIDIRFEPEWQKLRDPKHWVERARWEYEAVHKARADGHYIGGSLVRPGANDAPGKWFEECLKLGLDQYLDAWDVHAYPAIPPVLEGPLGDAGFEGDRGVLAAYQKIGRMNQLPYWLGETGAKAAYGFEGRRFQAELAAKMSACVNSRADVIGLAFCISHEYDLGMGRLWDYSMGHKPGEAALYTAGALIDGLPYRRIKAKDNAVQAAYFGDTFMIWRTDDAMGEWSLKCDPSKAWVSVDVVGGVRPFQWTRREWGDSPSAAARCMS